MRVNVRTRKRTPAGATPTGWLGQQQNRCPALTGEKVNVDQRLHHDKGCVGHL